MKTFVLVLVIVGGAGRPATVTQEFTSFEKCEAAREQGLKAMRIGASVWAYAICVEK